MRLQANPHPVGGDKHFMYEALRLAHRGLGWTSPNPPVGCVIVRDGAILGRGWHNEPGGLHAETMALADCHDAVNAIAYITLEPCSHVGLQPACTSELQRAGVKRVVYGCEDADTRSAGKAAELLRGHGIEVCSGVLREECEMLLAPYLHAKRHNRPHVHLKLAVSLDGRIACANGSSQWLSGPESRGLAHYLRQQYDAVMVGRGTVVADNPRLTVRGDVLSHYADTDGMRRRDPVRIVIDPKFKVFSADRRLRIFEASQQRSETPALIVIGSAESTVPKAAHGIASTWRVETLTVGTTAAGALDLHEAASKLWELGITSVLVEGGSQLMQQYFSQRAADQLTLVYTPLLLGSDALGFSPPMMIQNVKDAPRLTVQFMSQLGADLAVTVSLPRD